MISVLSKPADQIGVADIQELIDSQVPEGEQIEFKQSLPTEDGSPDRWVTHGDRIGRTAKNKILEESVAFANAYAGTLVLGIAESTTRPPVAASICPIPKCKELAERLKLVFRDGVEPQIPSLQVFAVPTDGDGGVVIIRVGKSRLAPHRVQQTRECKIRRADRCEGMSMREIQDLTLNISRGTERLESRLTERAENLLLEFKRRRVHGKPFGVRVSAVPVGEERLFDRVYGDEDLHRPCLELSFFGEIVQVDCRESSWWKPRLRAARWDHTLGSVEDPYFYCFDEIHCDGIVEMSEISASNGLDPLSVLRTFASVAVWADHVRNAALRPVLEYAIDVEIYALYRDLSILGGSNYRRFTHADADDILGILPVGKTAFPRYSLASSADIATIVTLFERDFWNSIGQDPYESCFRLEKHGGFSRLVFCHDDRS